MAKSFRLILESGTYTGREDLLRLKNILDNKNFNPDKDRIPAIIELLRDVGSELSAIEFREREIRE